MDDHAPNERVFTFCLTDRDGRTVDAKHGGPVRRRGRRRRSAPDPVSEIALPTDEARARYSSRQAARLNPFGPARGAKDPDPHFIHFSSILACTGVHSGALTCTRLVSQPRVKSGEPNKDARLP